MAKAKEKIKKPKKPKVLKPEDLPSAERAATPEVAVATAEPEELTSEDGKVSETVPKTEDGTVPREHYRLLGQRRVEEYDLYRKRERKMWERVKALEAELKGVSEVRASEDEGGAGAPPTKTPFDGLSIFETTVDELFVSADRIRKAMGGVEASQRVLVLSSPEVIASLKGEEVSDG